ncbi:hypothetical protein [Escherichia coli]|uniref:hypothetical protein n=1 Tax=Escherichia coli TaxID=562 RepID=UPI0012FD5FA8|nr:hypothetical protein [Escherichia coli]QGY13404.1 hypothetical protein F6P95_16895 [Escherichia coli]
MALFHSRRPKLFHGDNIADQVPSLAITETFAGTAATCAGSCFWFLPRRFPARRMARRYENDSSTEFRGVERACCMFHANLVLWQGGNAPASENSKQMAMFRNGKTAATHFLITTNRIFLQAASGYCCSGASPVAFSPSFITGYSIRRI